ncbi:MAG: hypothetical protein RBR00_05825 [Gudongella oleilytica]|jgi:hypothetical protein|nr:hypothetical protein [Gudongella oleilytica]
MKIYKDRKIVLVTKHGKESVIRPVFEGETGCQLVTETRLDTDRLGTFSREIRRPKSQAHTARLKIKKGMKLSKADIAVASEGSFGLHPTASIPWNVELVMMYDRKEDLEIYGIHESPDTNYGHRSVKTYAEALQFAQEAGFPQHYLIIRPENEKSKHIIKDIDSFDKLRDGFFWCKSRSKSGNVFMETDMRAHANPTRMKNIEKATQNLVSNLLSFCPECHVPGFIPREAIGGLPCEMCGRESEITMKLVYACGKCGHRQEQLFPNGRFASAEYCHHCNP